MTSVGIKEFFLLQGIESRAERFGIPMTEEAKKQARAARFEQTTNGAKIIRKPAKLSMETGVRVFICTFGDEYVFVCAHFCTVSVHTCKHACYMNVCVIGTSGST